MTRVPRILIVDDDPLDIKLLQKALVDIGEVFSVTDGTAALALLRERPIDLILLDIVMPGLDGFMTCRALRQDHPEITVVFITAVTAYENEIKALEAGGNDFISKPFNIPVVRARVVMHLKFMAQHAERQRLCTLIEQGLAGVAEIDPDARLIRVNDRYCEIVGHSRAALLGRHLSEFTWPEDWARNQAVLQRLAAGGPAEIIEKRYRRQDGGVVHAQVSTALVRDAIGMSTGFLCLVADITERWEAEERLRVAEQRWKRALDGAGHGVWDWQIATGTVDFSSGWKTMLGYAEEDIGGDVVEWSTRVHPDDLPASEAAVQAHLAGATPSYECVHRLRCKDGSWKWILDRGMVFERDPSGRPLRMLGTHTDISAQKEAEQKLRESEGRYRELTAVLEQRVEERTAALRAANAALTASEARHRLLADHALDVIWTMDLAGHVTYVSPSVEKLRGYTPAEVMQQSLEEILTPDSCTLIRAALKEALANIRAGRPVQPFRGEVAEWCKDGSTVCVETTATVMRDQDGRFLELLGVSRNITERVRERERIAETLNILELATEAAEIGIWNWDFRTGTLTWDERMFDLYEVAEAERRCPLTHEVWQSYVHPEDLEQTQTWLQEAIRHRSSFAGVFRIRLPGERVRHIQAAGIVERDLAGQPRRILGVNRDITAQQEQEATLRAAKQAAEEANAAKSAFLAHMSHEIRTPMNAVLGLGQVLEKTPLSPDQRHMVTQIGIAGRSLLGILNDILDLSKIEAGQLQVEEHPFTLASLLDQIETLLGRTAQDKGLTLSIAGPPLIAGALIGDPLRLEQVLVNLIGNAIKFSDQGEVRVLIAPLATTDREMRLRFTVHDTGIGIAPATLAGLFTPFTQADGSITRRFGGTGLGLSICKRLVELMGGEIGAESTLGEGSTFWFEVTFRRTAANEPQPIPAPAEATPRGPRLAGLHLLVVDDSRMNREVVERMLTLEGARAATVVDGQQALDRLRAQPQAFDVVLMDIQMPVMDGLTATRLIRAELGLIDLPIIALTAGVLPEQQAAARAAGVDGVLVKPLDLEQLVTLLSPWVGSPALSVTPPRRTEEGRGGTAGQAPDGAQTERSTAPWVTGPDRAAAFPVIPGIDRDQAARGTDYDLAFFRRLLQRFAEDFSAGVDQIRQDLAADERVTAARRIHSLRGSAAYLGALELMATAGDLEEAIAAGASGLSERLATLEAQLTGLIDASAVWRTSTDPDIDPDATGGGSVIHAAPSLDPVQFETLCTALRQQNFRARRLYQELEPTLQGLLDGETQRALARSMRELRFAEALSLLERVRPIHDQG